MPQLKVELSKKLMSGYGKYQKNGASQTYHNIIYVPLYCWRTPYVSFLNALIDISTFRIGLIQTHAESFPYIATPYSRQ
jgi:hypothetical protein